MIQGLFETHINVSNLEKSIEFYCGTLGLPLSHREARRRIAFIMLGGPGQSMLGLWEKPHEQVFPQHFAFRATVDDIVNRAVPWLKERGLACHNFLNDGTERPMVIAWMPAISIYRDPDAHSLELIAMLPGKPRPELGVVPLEDWERSC
jgi:catechol 2,3-dioxygenase-like lactoylglutathione lyase family enzyme